MKILTKWIGMLLLFVVCLLFVSTANAQTADSAFQNVDPEALANVFRQATSQKRIVTQLNATPQGNTIVFTGRLAPNVDERSWYTMINVDQRKLQQAQREFATKGYQQIVLTSAVLAGRTYYTGAWAAVVLKGNLILPDEPFPVTGDEVMAAVSIDQAMRQFLKEHNCPGLAVCIAKDGKQLYSRGFGWSDKERKKPVRPDTRFRIASISKSLTAAAIMKLIEQRRLNLEDPVVPLLKQLRRLKTTKFTDKRWDTVTVHQLLQHKGGWDAGATFDPMFRLPEITAALEIRRSPTPIDVIKFQADRSLDFEPGHRYAYSNFGYCLLGRVIEAVTEQSYYDALESLVLEPAGMTGTFLGRTERRRQRSNEATYYTQKLSQHTEYTNSLFRVTRNARPAIPGFVPAPYGRWGLEVMDSHGGLLSTAPDLVRFAIRLDTGDKRILQEPTLEAMTGLSENQNGAWYGCGWSVQKRIAADTALGSCSIWHTGGLDGTSALLFRRFDGFTWAILFNCDYSQNGTRLADLMLTQMHGLVNSVTWE